MDDPDQAVETLRKEQSRVDIRRPGAVGDCDTHGNVWYCFSCTKITNTMFKDHRSFCSARAMLGHLRDVHRLEPERHRSFHHW